jgi:ATP-dependent protease ClpP protease subunit
VNEVNPELSKIRSEAGRRGAEARWAKAKRAEPAKSWREGLEAFRNEKPKDQPGWRIENAAGEGDTPADLYIYDEIDAWWGVGARDVTQALAAVSASDITVHLNSPGGDVWEAHAIYNALRAHKATVTVHVDGIAASAASYVAQAGDTVLMASNATMMIHDAIGITFGNAADHLETAAILDQQSDIIAGIYADRAGGTVDEWRTAMRAETWYNADQAVEAGLATGILEHDAGTSNAVDTAVYGEAARKLAATKDTTEPGDSAAGAEVDPLDGFDFSELAESLKGALA